MSTNTGVEWIAVHDEMQVQFATINNIYAYDVVNERAAVPVTMHVFYVRSFHGFRISWKTLKGLC